jgi:hypothetical protein
VSAIQVDLDQWSVAASRFALESPPAGLKIPPRFLSQQATQPDGLKQRSKRLNQTA